MSISKSTVINIVLSYIGGFKLDQPESSTIFGTSPIACRAGGLSAGLSEIAQSMATGAIGFEEGLGLVSQNPLSDVITETRSTLSDYTTGSFSGLDSALPGVSGDVALATQYSNLKLALGGADGLSGAVAQLDKFEQHTDRLSGVKLSSDSSQANTASTSSGSDYIYYNGLQAGTPTAIIQFSSTSFRSAKYFIQGSAGVEHQTTEVFLIHDNSRVYLREIDQIYTIDPFISFTANINNNVISVLANTTINNTDFVIYGTKLEVASNSEFDDTISQEKILESAKALRGFFPDDETDFVRSQANSVFKGALVTEMGRELRDMVTSLNSDRFSSMSTAEKQAELEFITSNINSRSMEMQDSIDSDLNSYEEAKKKIEAASILSNITSNYTNSEAVDLLNLTLKPSIVSEI